MTKEPGVFRIIGICGRSGAGKTTVCAEFEKLGYRSIDTDRVYRELTRPDDEGMPSELVRRIAHEFGGQVIASDGSLNRAVLSNAVFGKGERDRLLRLNSITHKSIIERTDVLIEQSKSEGAVGAAVDAPALFESGFDARCDAIVCVTAPRELSIKRISERDRISAEAAGRRIDSQIDERTLLNKSDFVIVNDGVNDLAAAVLEIVGKIAAL